MKKIIVIIGALCLSGCAYLGQDKGPFRDHAKDYARSDSVDTLRVPEGFEFNPDRSTYPMPTGEIAHSSEKALLPPGF